MVNKDVYNTGLLICLFAYFFIFPFSFCFSDVIVTLVSRQWRLRDSSLECVVNMENIFK